MPVIGTPLTLPAGATDPDLHILVPEISTAFDETLLAKKRAILIRQNTKPYLRMPVVNRSGVPVNLSDYSVATGTGHEYIEEAMGETPTLPDLSTTPHVAVRYREGALVTRTTYEVIAEVLDATAGTIIAEIPAQVADYPGVWLAEAGVLDALGNLLFTNEVYVYNEHSAWAAADNYLVGPPQVTDIRLSLRDNDPLENEIINNYDWGLAELSFAAIRTVQFWNAQPPRIASAVYTACSFPDREIWLTGTQLFLFEMAEEHYRRNRLPYNAGGIALDDKAKAPEYNKAWQERFQRFRQLVMATKAQVNMARGFGSFGSAYGARF